MLEETKASALWRHKGCERERGAGDVFFSSIIYITKVTINLERFIHSIHILSMAAFASAMAD